MRVYFEKLYLMGVRCLNKYVNGRFYENYLEEKIFYLYLRRPRFYLMRKKVYAKGYSSLTSSPSVSVYYSTNWSLRSIFIRLTGIFLIFGITFIFIKFLLNQQKYLDLQIQTFEINVINYLLLNFILILIIYHVYFIIIHLDLITKFKDLKEIDRDL